MLSALSVGGQGGSGGSRLWFLREDCISSLFFGGCHEGGRVTGTGVREAQRTLSSFPLFLTQLCPCGDVCPLSLVRIAAHFQPVYFHLGLLFISARGSLFGELSINIAASQQILLSNPKTDLHYCTLACLEVTPFPLERNCSSARRSMLESVLVIRETDLSQISSWGL